MKSYRLSWIWSICFAYVMWYSPHLLMYVAYLLRSAFQISADMWITRLISISHIHACYYINYLTVNFAMSSPDIHFMNSAPTMSNQTEVSYRKKKTNVYVVVLEFIFIIHLPINFLTLYPNYFSSIKAKTLLYLFGVNICAFDLKCIK